jgi:non-ribosomal peptide synthetase component F
MDTEEMKRQEAYWLKEFSGGVPVLDIPLDYERPENRDFEGAHTRFEISPAQIMRLREYAAAGGTTMFTVLLAVFYILLAKLSGSDDIVVGTPAAGRRHPDLYGIIGAFVNTLALRNYPGPDKSFDGFLKEVKQRTLAAFDNQDYQFEDLVKNVYIKRPGGRNPIFDVLFTFFPRGREAFRTQGKTRGKRDAFADMKKYEGQDRQSMLDLILNVVETDSSSIFSFSFKYCTKLLKKETIEKYITYFKEIVSAVVENKHITLKEIKISHDLERAKIEVPQITFGF